MVKDVQNKISTFNAGKQKNANGEDHQQAIMDFVKQHEGQCRPNADSFSSNKRTKSSKQSKRRGLTMSAFQGKTESQLLMKNAFQNSAHTSPKEKVQKNAASAAKKALLLEGAQELSADLRMSQQGELQSEKLGTKRQADWDPVLEDAKLQKITAFFKSKKPAGIVTAQKESQLKTKHSQVVKDNCQYRLSRRICIDRFDNTRSNNEVVISKKKVRSSEHKVKTLASRRGLQRSSKWGQITVKSTSKKSVSIAKQVFKGLSPERKVKANSKEEYECIDEDAIRKIVQRRMAKHRKRHRNAH